MFKLWFLLATQLYSPGPQAVTFHSDVDDSEQRYALYLPKSYDASRKYPLVIHLRGPSSHRAINLFHSLDFIVASPHGRGAMDYEGIAEQDVYDVLAHIQGRFPIDEDRVYLAGLSMGGKGALRLGLTRPDIWAAMALVCAATPGGVEGLTANALNIPVHLFHGDQDPAVPVESSRQWYRQFLAAGVKAEYVEYPGVRHNSWDMAYKRGAIYDWLAQFRRVHHPEHVKFSTRAYRYNSAYWVHLDSLTPGELASIDARFTADNKLEVHTSQLDGFTLRLAGHPRFSPRSAVLVTVDGAPLRLKPADTVSFVKTQKGWKSGRNEPAPGRKRPGLKALYERLSLPGTSTSTARLTPRRRRN